METKKCNICGAYKPINRFTRNLVGGSIVYRNICCACNMKEHRRRKKEREQNNLLGQFNSKDLIRELKSRGYQI